MDEYANYYSYADKEISKSDTIVENEINNSKSKYISLLKEKFSLLMNWLEK
jgi:hypothetical protein